MHARKSTSFRFSTAIARRPGLSSQNGLRGGNGLKSSPDIFREEHAAYRDTLKRAGVSVVTLPALEAFPDSVFVEDTALCLFNCAILLRLRASTRAGEPTSILPELHDHFEHVVKLGGRGTVDGGDVLLTDKEAIVGLSSRTNQQGAEALAKVLHKFGYRTRVVQTPPGLLHFKTGCGLLDSETVFACKEIANSIDLGGYRIIEAPDLGAANVVRVNDHVLINCGYPRTTETLECAGYSVLEVPAGQAALLDGGLSCMSLRIPS